MAKLGGQRQVRFVGTYSNIILLCANSGAQLHLIQPLGFALDDKRLRRAGLNCHEFANLQLHAGYPDFQQWLAARPLFACTTKARQHHDIVLFKDESLLLFGPKSRGLLAEILDSIEFNQKIRISIYPDSRSLNLSNATAIILYEAW